MNATVTAQIGTTDWHLTGIRTSSAGETCEHCPRTLKNLYDVKNMATGQTMTVGRGCCKKVTGWTLAASEATRILRAAERQARKAAAWAEFTTRHPEIADRLAADTSYSAAEVKDEIKSGSSHRWAHWIRVYESRR